MERNMDMKLEDLVLGQAKIRKCKDILVTRNKRRVGMCWRMRNGPAYLESEVQCMSSGRRLDWGFERREVRPLCDLSDFSH